MPNFHLRQLVKRSCSPTSVNKLRASWSSVRNRVEVRDLSFFLKRPGPLWGPSCLLFSGHRNSFTGVKRPGHKADKVQLLPRSNNRTRPKHGRISA